MCPWNSKFSRVPAVGREKLVVEEEIRMTGPDHFGTGRLVRRLDFIENNKENMEHFEAKRENLCELE